MKNTHILTNFIKNARAASLFLVATLLATTASFGQNLDNKGKDFYLMFNSNIYNSGSKQLFITSDVNTSGTVSGSTFSTISFSVTANTITTVSLPNSIQDHTSDVVDNKGFHIVANDDIAIYGLNQASATTDAYLGLPTDVLGTDYMVLTYKGLGASYGSQLGVVATENSTTVTITPSVTVGSHPAGTAYTVNMNAGQTYQLETNSSTANDLTGSIVTSNKPIGVFGASRCSNIPTGYYACDAICEMMPPRSTWGTKFGTVPLKTRTRGDTWRFLATENGTTVSINGTAQSPSLNQGQFLERILTTASIIESNKPILVAQYSNGTGFDNVTSDPFIMLIPPIEQFQSSYTVGTPSSGFSGHYVNLIAPNSVVGSLTFDASAIASSEFTAIGSSGYSSAKITVSAGSHTFTSTLPFGVFSYGFGSADSYGYAGGQSFSPVATVSTVDISPATGTSQIDVNQCWEATVLDQNSDPVVGVKVDFDITGANSTLSGFANTDSSGVATFCYTGTNGGNDAIYAHVGSIGDSAAFTWTTCVAPQLTCPSNMTVDNDLGKCGANVTFEATATGTSPNITYSHASGSLFPVGSTVVTSTATNDCGTDSCQFTITVKDVEKPIAIAQNLTINLDSTGNASITAAQVDNGSNDACGVTLAISQSDFDCSDVKVSSRHKDDYALDFTNGNDYVVIGVVTPASQSYTKEAWVKAASTSCDNIISSNQNPFWISGGYLRAGNGNNYSVVTDPNTFTANTWTHVAVTYDAATTTMRLYKNGTQVAVNTSSPGNSGGVSAIGKHYAGGCHYTGQINEVRIWNYARSASELSNNLGATLMGNESGLTAYYPMEEGTGSGTADVTGNGFNGTFSGMASNPWVASNGLNIGGDATNTITLTVTDGNNNVSTTTSTITVVDAIAPIAICNSFDVQLDNTGAASITVAQVNNGSNDACGIKSVSIDKSTFDCSHVGTNAVTLTVTDNNDNVSTCIATITVKDEVAPIAICKNVSITLANGTASITAADIDNGSNDACGIKSVSASKTTFACEDLGANTVVLTVTDNNQNVSTCTATVNVLGDAPSCTLAVTPDDNTYTGGVATNMYIGYGPTSSTITCSPTGGSSFSYSWSGNHLSGSGNAVTFTPTTAGNHTIICTVTNNNGCVTTCSVTICVKDIQAGGSGKNQKVYLCHVPPGNPNNPQTLSVSINSIASHLSNHSGDALGMCTQTCGSSKRNPTNNEIVYSGDGLNILVYPNPSSTEFAFEVETDVDQEISIVILDMTGKQVIALEEIMPHQIVKLGGQLAAGVYLAKIRQGENYKVVKITKSK